LVTGSTVLFAASAVSQTNTTLGAHGEADAGEAFIQLTVLGTPAVTVDQLPMDEAGTPAAGGNTPVQAASENVMLGAIPMVSLQGIATDADDTAPGITVTAQGSSSISNASLLGGLINVTGLQASVQDAVDDSSGTPQATLSGQTTVGSITVAGVTVLQGPLSVAPNTSIPISLNVPVNVAGLINTTLPVSGTMTINEQAPLGPDGLNVNGFHLVASGSVAGLASLTLDIILAGPGAQASRETYF
jgi:hypothetical protein